MNTFLTLANHGLPLIISLLVIIVTLVLVIGLPYLRFVELVAKATNDEGVIALAKYLAKKTGGRYIHVDDKWESFIPAAKELHIAYKYRSFRLFEY